MTVYVAMYGPYITSPVQLAVITDKGVQYVGEMTGVHEQGSEYYNKYVPKVQRLVQSLKRKNIKIHGFDYYGHSAGPLIGDGWYHSKNFLTVTDLVRYVLQPLQPRVLIFDSCYMGVISALYELSQVKSIQWVMASPTYHPSYYVLETEAFGKVGTKSHDKAFLGKQLRAISCAFQELTRPSYRCFILIDLQKIPALVRKLTKLNHEDFVFTRETQLSRADAITHDLYQTVKDSNIKRMVKHISKDTCGLQKCKVAQGISFEKSFPDAHRGLYKSMQWYKAMSHFYEEN